MTLAVLIVAAVVALGGVGGLAAVAVAALRKDNEPVVWLCVWFVVCIVLTFLSGVPL